MIRVYVAGAYSADNPLKLFENMRIGMRVGTQLLQAGFAPFVPWLDYHLWLMLRDEETLTIQDFYAYSLAWLEVSDILLVVPGWENSTGTKGEIKKAEEMGIKIYYSLRMLLVDTEIEHPELQHQIHRIKGVDW